MTAPFFWPQNEQMCGAESPRVTNVGEASLHLPVGCLDGPGWPATATAVTNDMRAQQRKAGQATKALWAHKVAQAEQRGPHPYFAACVCRHCVARRAA